ncbi:hypothetical protein RHECIAT_CH0001394 [Rhizobium etli CIAT 652]|uniref:Uncharacterized protein n=1 Tax=Rhizobium etli (strain CIAT 652) TaxID=491916 RepID=B3PU70_RHIE6|nr:hypothetical protein RHECIAT_CH0001394 [Rhizobium etli CIAT 652]
MRSSRAKYPVRNGWKRRPEERPLFQIERGFNGRVTFGLLHGNAVPAKPVIVLVSEAREGDDRAVIVVVAALRPAGRVGEREMEKSRVDWWWR